MSSITNVTALSGHLPPLLLNDFPSSYPSLASHSQYAAHFVAVTTILVLLYRYICYPVLISPLSSIPCAHPLAAITPLWMDWKRLTGREVTTTFEAFKNHGPYVRLGPSEIAVNTITGGITNAHGHGPQNFNKTSWYDFFINYG